MRGSSAFEEDVAREGTRAEQIQASQAISLKRIADSLGRLELYYLHQINLLSTQDLLRKIGWK